MAIDESLVNTDIQQSNINSLEKAKFDLDANNEVVVKTKVSSGLIGSSDLLANGKLLELHEEH